jgi:hypothetical protein
LIKKAIILNQGSTELIEMDAIGFFKRCATLGKNRSHSPAMARIFNNVERFLRAQVRRLDQISASLNVFICDGVAS